jgi:hypothetical protein
MNDQSGIWKIVSSILDLIKKWMDGVAPYLTNDKKIVQLNHNILANVLIRKRKNHCFLIKCILL